MLDNIRFCYCARLDEEEENARQCMFFSFSKRAKKVLSEDFLKEITYASPEENIEKTGIPLIDREITNGDKVFITKVEDDRYRIASRYIEPFVRCLFKYLPAYYVAPDEVGKNYECDVRKKGGNP